MEKLTQRQMARRLRITDAYMSEILGGKKHPRIPRPMAEKLAEIFPSKSYQEWRDSNPEEIRKAFVMEKIDGHAN